MTPWEDRVRVVVGSISLELPTALVDKRNTAVDSAASVFEGSGLTVTVDQGPFASRLDADVGRPAYREGYKDIGGTRSRTVFFRSADGRSFTTGLHVPAPKHVTVVIQADKSVPEEVATAIRDSVQLLGN